MSRVLYLDRDPIVAEKVAKKLSFSFDCDHASSPAELVGKWEQRGGFSVVVKDLRCWDEDAIVELDLVRSLSERALVIVLTELECPELFLTCVNELGVSKYLLKPVPLATLEEAISESLSKYECSGWAKGCIKDTLSATIGLLADISTQASIEVSEANFLDMVEQLASELEIFLPWEGRLAARLTQLGTLVLNEQERNIFRNGDAKTEEFQDCISSVFERLSRLITRIPRLCPVSNLFLEAVDADGWISTARPPENRIGSLLKAVFLWIHFLSQGLTQFEVFNSVKNVMPHLSDNLVESLQRMDLRISFPTIDIPTSELTAGVVIAENIVDGQGRFVVTCGRRLDWLAIEKLRRLHPERSIVVYERSCDPSLASSNVAVIA